MVQPAEWVGGIKKGWETRVQGGGIKKGWGTLAAPNGFLRPGQIPYLTHGNCLDIPFGGEEARRAQHKKVLTACKRHALSCLGRQVGHQRGSVAQELSRAAQDTGPP